MAVKHRKGDGMTIDQRADALAEKLNKGGVATLSANKAAIVALLQNMAHAIQDMNRRLSALEGGKDGV